MSIVVQWYEHPFPTLPRAEVKELHAALGNMKDTGVVQHPRLDTLVPPPKLHQPTRKKRKKDIHGAEMAATAQSVIDEYMQGGWEVAYTDGSSDTHPQAGMVGGYGVYFGDCGDMAAPLPTKEKQTISRGELRAALHAIRLRNPKRRTLICSDSQLVVMGATGKASKWQRHDWQGFRRLVGHVDLWEQLLH